MPHPKNRASSDVALLYAPTEDGKGARIVRARAGSLEAGEIRPVKEGQPLNQGELVKLTPRAGMPCICDVEVLHKAAASEPAEQTGDAETGGRPAQVATEDYRENWDRIFGRRMKRDRSLN